MSDTPDITVNSHPDFSALYQRRGVKYDMAALDKFISTDMSDSYVVSFLNYVFPYAARNRASDVHFSDGEDGCHVRLRIDGDLVEVFHFCREAAQMIDQKIRSRCNISHADREGTYGGSFWFKHDDTLIDVRVSIMPTKMGQSMVCRILDQANAGRSFADVHVTDLVRAALQAALSEPEGLILACGPTGSGKTSTLYACLNHINRPGINIVTVEDPVEYRLPGGNQVNAHPHHRPFARVLREMLRQDPDVILVGEIRDQETAETAVAAALTGHLVLSSLHANDARTALMERFKSLGVERYTVAQSITAVFAQRLAKRLCLACAGRADPSSEQLAMIATHGMDLLTHFAAHNPEGCVECGHTGWSGRLPVIELALGSTSVSKAIMTGSDDALRDAFAEQPQYQTLTQAALTASSQGLLDLEHALRIVKETHETT